jgi:hypothetical protein
MRKCRNCDNAVLIRTEREGLVHANGLYGCHRKDTVAE